MPAVPCMASVGPNLGSILPQLVLPAWWGAKQRDALGPLLQVAVECLALCPLSTAHPELHAFHNDVDVACPPTALPAALTDAERIGRVGDANLAPAWCVGC